MEYASELYCEMLLTVDTVIVKRVSVAVAYRIRNTGRLHPDYNAFRRPEKRLCEGGDVFPKAFVNRDHPMTALTPANEHTIIAAAGRQRIAQELGISKATVSEVLRDEKLYPCYYSQSPHLFPENRHVRIHFCERLRLEHARNEIFFDHKSLNEACFTPDSALSNNINRIRARKNPHVVS